MIGVGSLGQVAASRLFVVLALASCAILGGCGRKGPLELPPGTPQAGQNQPKTQTGAAQPTTDQATTSPAIAAAADAQAVILNQDAPSGVIQSPNQVIKSDKSAAAVAAAPPKPPINGAPTNKPKTFLLDPVL